MAGVAVFGANSIQSVKGTSDLFTLGWVGDTPGTYDIAQFLAGNYSMDFSQSGKVKITSISIDAASFRITAKGTFSVDITDDKGTEYKHVIGSFNVKK